MRFKFKPAARDESIVFGAERSGYPAQSVDEGMIRDWILFMKDKDIKRVCCLLSQSQLDYESNHFSSLPFRDGAFKC